MHFFVPRLKLFHFATINPLLTNYITTTDKTTGSQHDLSPVRYDTKGGQVRLLSCHYYGRFFSMDQ